jgi:branched-chain amino acid transport system permease protein
MAGRSRGLSRTTVSSLVTYALVIIAFIVVQAMVSNHMLTYSLQGQLVPICAYIVMAVSLNLVVGLSGELSLGHAGFMSVGAFTGVVVAASLTDAIPNPVLRLIVAMLFGGGFAAIAGFLIGIPVMRLHGDYLAIVTLAFGEIIKNLLNNLYVGIDDAGVHFSFSSAEALGMAQGGKVVINGPQGAVGITKLSTFVIGFVLVLLAVFVVLNLKGSRSGRAIMAVRDNRIAAESVGINTTKYRLMAFVLSAALAGMAGVLYGMNYSSIVPKKFDFNTSILILVFVVLGGMGSIRGSIISATVLTILPEALRAVNDYRMLLYAIVLILVMLVTNNPTLKQLWRRIKGSFRRTPKEPAVASEGGDVDA